MPKASQPVSDRAENQTQAIGLQKCVLCTAVHPAFWEKGEGPSLQSHSQVLITIPSYTVRELTLSKPILQPRSRSVRGDPAICSPCTDAGDSSPPCPVSSRHEKFVFCEATSYLQVS